MAGFNIFSGSVFKDEKVLSFDYVPPYLPFREEKLALLTSFFRYLAVEGSEGLCQKALIVGRVGTGKTATAKLLGRVMAEELRKRGVEFKFVYANCYADRSLFLVAQRMLEAVDPKSTSRGLAVAEAFKATLKALEEVGTPMLVVLDEVHYFAKAAGHESLYNLIRLLEAHESKAKLGFLMISRGKEFVYELDDYLRSSLTRNVVEFEPYTSTQLKVILDDRVRAGFKENSVMPETVELIADAIGRDRGGNGDARLAIEVLWRAGKVADFRFRRVVTPEDAREAMSYVHPAVRVDELRNILLHEKLVLLALAKELKVGRSYVGMWEVHSRYRAECEQLNLKPRKRTQFWVMLRELEKMGFIISKLEKRGNAKAKLVGLPAIPAVLLEKLLLRLIRREAEVDSWEAQFGYGEPW